MAAALRTRGTMAGVVLLAACFAAVPADGQIGRRAPPPVRVLPGAQSEPTFGGVDFRIRTGDDDLRFDSTAWIDLIFANGKQSCGLKAWKEDTWGNGSTHEAACNLSPPRSLSELRTARVILNYFSDPDPNNFVTWDNWNVNSVVMSAVNPGTKAVPVLCVGADPLVRMKGDLRSIDLRSFASTC